VTNNTGYLAFFQVTDKLWIFIRKWRRHPVLNGKQQHIYE